MTIEEKIRVLAKFFADVRVVDDPYLDRILAERKANIWGFSSRIFGLITPPHDAKTLLRYFGDSY